MDRKEGLEHQVIIPELDAFFSTSENSILVVQRTKLIVRIKILSLFISFFEEELNDQFECIFVYYFNLLKI
jgi:hypothetical protein